MFLSYEEWAAFASADQYTDTRGSYRIAGTMPGGAVKLWKVVAFEKCMRYMVIIEKMQR